MDKFRNYEIAFVGLKQGKHHFKYSIRQSFFDLFEAEQDFRNAQIEAEVTLDKHSTFLEFVLKISGNVELVCDISGENFTQPVENEMKFLVKFGEKYDDSNEEVITIPHGDSEYNIAQQIYEAVVLAIPMKKISPELSEQDLQLLEKFSPKPADDEEEKNDDTETDPRWEALKNLKNKN